jgi:hypothetical protein
MKVTPLSVVHEHPTPTSAEVLEPSGVHARQVDQAMKQVIDALSEEPSKSTLAYGVVLYSRKHRKLKHQYLAAAGTFFRAYLRGWHALSHISHMILTSADQDHLQTLEAQDFRDVRFFVGRATPKDIKDKMQPSPGIYILSSHLDAALLRDLGLPLLPQGIRDVPFVMQVSAPVLTEEGEPTTSWPGWGELEDSTPPVESGEAEIARDTLRWRKEFISENECWSSAKVATESTSRAKNRAAIASRWAAETRIFSVRFQGQQRFPRFQFQDGEPLPLISEVIHIFPEGATGWELAYFFATPNPNIEGRKPLELLKSDPSRVLSLARAFARPADVF